MVFTTIQKFMPETRGDTFPLLSDRANIVVVADEAHRSQYDFIDGFARHMRDALPNASFIGFTGTPIDAADKSTRSVFGDYVSVYDIQRAVEDGATVPIYYESRLAKIELKADEIPHLDEAFDELTEGEEIEGREKLKSKWSALEALVGSDLRLQTDRERPRAALRGASRGDGRKSDARLYEPADLCRFVQGSRSAPPRLARRRRRQGARSRS